MDEVEGEDKGKRGQKGSTKASKACDQCNTRKVKCIRPEPDALVCTPCQKQKLECTSDKIHKKRGPKKRTRGDSEPDQNGESSHDIFHQPLRPASSRPSQPAASTSHSLNHVPLPETARQQQPPFASMSIYSNSTSYVSPSATSQPLNVGSSQGLGSVSSYASSGSYSAAPVNMPSPGWPPLDPIPRTTSARSQPVDLPAVDASALSFDSLADPFNSDSAVLRYDFGLFSALDFGDLSIPPDLAQSLETTQNDLAAILGGPSQSPASTVSVTESTDQSYSFRDLIPDVTDHDLTLGVTKFLARHHPMVPLVHPTRFLSDFRHGKHKRSRSFAVLLMSVLAIIESGEQSEAQRTAAATTNEDSSKPAPGPWLSRTLATLGRPWQSSKPDANALVTIMHLFVAFDMIGDREAAWYHLQEAITLAHILHFDQFEAPPRDFDLQDTLRIFFTMFICERAVAMLQHLPARLNNPLRLADDAYLRAQHTIPPDVLSSALDAFPVPHLRMFSLITSQVLQCWHGLCSLSGSGCANWNVERAVQLQRDLERESLSAMNTLNSGTSGPLDLQIVNLVISIAWLRDRFWNICNSHGLVSDNGPAELRPAFIQDLVKKMLDFLDQIRSSDFDIGLDWAAKLYDLSMTAVGVLHHLKHRPANQQAANSPEQAQADEAHSVSKSRLLAYIFRVVGLFTQYPNTQKTLLPGLIKAVALVS